MSDTKNFFGDTPVWQRIIVLVCTFMFVSIATVCVASSHVEAATNTLSDVDHNGVVDNADLGKLISHYRTSAVEYDLNRDNTIDIIDISILLSNFSGDTTPPIVIDGVQSAPVTAFSSTVGVNVHASFTDTPYGNWTKVKTELTKLGVHTVRDGNYHNLGYAKDKIWQLAPLGIKINIGTEVGEVPEQIANIASAPAGFVTSIESVNEPDCFLSKTDANWVANAQDHMRKLYAAAKSNPATKNIPVLGSSYCRETTLATIGNMSAYYDGSAFHPYPNPGITPEADVASRFVKQEPWISGKPLYATETGYHNAINFVGGHPPITETGAGVYIPRAYLNNYMSGIKESQMYELVDIRPSDSLNLYLYNNVHFGLYRYNWTEKPAATSLRRMMTVLKDTGVQASPQKLPYTLSGDTSNVKQLLLQKSNGKFELILWRDEIVYNSTNRRDLPIENRAIQVNFSDRSREISRYNINVADAAVEQSTSQHYQFELGQQVQILEIN